MVKQKKTPEFLFVFYLFGFAMLRPVLYLSRAFSNIVIVAFLLYTILVSLLNTHAFPKKYFYLAYFCIIARRNTLILPNRSTNNIHGEFFHVWCAIWVFFVKCC